MSIILRVVLLVATISFEIFVLKKIQKSQMKIESSIFLILFSAVIAILCFFPELAILGAMILGIESPVNLVFLVIIFLLIMLVFSMAVKISNLEYKIAIIVEDIAIKEKLSNEK